MWQSAAVRTCEPAPPLATPTLDEETPLATPGGRPGGRVYRSHYRFTVFTKQFSSLASVLVSSQESLQNGVLLSWSLSLIIKSPACTCLALALPTKNCETLQLINASKRNIPYILPGMLHFTMEMYRSAWLQ